MFKKNKMPVQTHPPIYIYTDGAAAGNPGPGGYGAVLICGTLRKEISGGFRLTTNNRMELMAVIKALEAIKWPGSTVHLTSDSSYVVKAVNEGWLQDWVRKGFKGKKNQDLWERFLPLYKAHNVKFYWIKGHDGHPENERCDTLAVEARLEENLPADTGYEELNTTLTNNLYDEQ